LPDEAVAAIGAQLAHGASAAASVGLTHRELSPSQVRVTHDGTVKILGLGSARLLGDDAATPIVGREAEVTYLAPEQVESGRSDHRSDIYTIGLMLWELSAGALPFSGHLAERLESDVPPLRGARPSVSTGLSATIERATRRRPEERWQDPRELGSRLLEECAARPKQVVRDIAAWLLPEPPAPVSTLRSGAAGPAGDEAGDEARSEAGDEASTAAAGSTEPAPSDR
jgi:eukaryotic-like serine/threonine-protein kinase